MLHWGPGIHLLEDPGNEDPGVLGYLWLGEVYSEADRLQDAVENLKTAEDKFREMGMEYWLGKTQDVLGRL